LSFPPPPTSLLAEISLEQLSTWVFSFTDFSHCRLRVELALFFRDFSPSCSLESPFPAPEVEVQWRFPFFDSVLTFFCPFFFDAIRFHLKLIISCPSDFTFSILLLFIPFAPPSNYFPIPCHLMSDLFILSSVMGVTPSLALFHLPSFRICPFFCCTLILPSPFVQPFRHSYFLKQCFFKSSFAYSS